MTSLAPDVALQRMVDEAEITRVIHQYARGIDRRDRELVRSCYHPDAIDSHGTFTGTRDEFLDWSFPFLERYTGTTHHMMNVLVDLAGDAALVETYAIAHHFGDPPDDRRLNFRVGFRYIDRFERRGGGPWLIAERTVVFDWAENWVSNPKLQRKLGATHAADGPTDPLYDIASRVPGLDLRRH